MKDTSSSAVKTGAADARFVVATPTRSVCDDNARALERHSRLRFIALGTRRGTAGVPPERTRLKPGIGLAAYAAVKLLSNYQAESFRFRLHPWFDRWVKRQLQPGDHIISSYGYVNQCFRTVRQHGGRTFVDGGNSHPENFWTVISEEHRRWHCPYPPFSPYWYKSSLAMLEETDYVLSPSSHVTNSFLTRGFRPEQILRNVYPVNLDRFSPSPQPRPKDRPLTLINTGSLSLRKGTPYLLEAFRIIHQRHPSARLFLSKIVQDSAREVMARYRDLPIHWTAGLPHSQVPDLLRSADLFVLPSLEEGLVRTACEAMACGLPAIVTPNTGINDFVESGVNGEVVPIRDPKAIAEAVFKWADKILSPDWQPRALLDTKVFSFEHFENEFIGQLRAIGQLP